MVPVSFNLPPALVDPKYPTKVSHSIYDRDRSVLSSMIYFRIIVFQILLVFYCLCLIEIFVIIFLFFFYALIPKIKERENVIFIQILSTNLESAKVAQD